MAKKLLVSEVLDLVAKAETKKEKIAVLREHNSLELRDILKGAFDDSIEFILPKGVPPINEEEKRLYDKTRLMSETRSFVTSSKAVQVNKSTACVERRCSSISYTELTAKRSQLSVT